MAFIVCFTTWLIQEISHNYYIFNSKASNLIIVFKLQSDSSQILSLKDSANIIVLLVGTVA